MKIFYDDRQTARASGSFSPSAQKPAKVVKSWLKLDPSAEVVPFKPLQRIAISAAHDRKYVDGIFDLEIPNGFHTKSQDIAWTLHYTTGSMFAASVHAWKTKESCASPTSGFHHAKYDDGGCFCTFNGLAIAAVLLRQMGARNIGILDLDAHYGNGTDNIIWRLGLEYIVHYTYGGDRVKPETAGQWLLDLPGILQHFEKCDVVLYQAGVDPHIDDPLGGDLTTAQLYERDLIVFQALKSMNVPVAWNLAGGYQTPISKVLRLHDGTLKAFLSVN